MTGFVLNKQRFVLNMTGFDMKIPVFFLNTGFVLNINVFFSLNMSGFFVYTRRYGLLCGSTSSSCGGLWPSAPGFFLPFGQKKRGYHGVLAYFDTCLVSSSNLGNFSANLSNFKNNPKTK